MARPLLLLEPASLDKEVMDYLPDGEAVAAARARLVGQGVPDQEGWRSTVVAAPESGWLVRTWTTTPPESARPTGQPQYVHHVEIDQDGHPLLIEQLHPVAS